MKIAIISSCSLPVPAVKGGAVESLIESLVIQNEQQTTNHITVFTLFDAGAVEEEKKYKNTTFLHLKKNKSIELLDNLITRALRFVKRDPKIASKNYIWKIILLHKIEKELLSSDFDKIVLQNTIFLFQIFKNKNLHEKYAGKVYFHIHNELTKYPSIPMAGILKRVISISDYLHNNIKKYLGADVDIQTVHNGIDCKLFAKKLEKIQCEEILRMYGIPAESKIVVFVGRITPEKGILHLIRAFNRIKDEKMHLLIVGSCYFGSGALSPFEDELMKLIGCNSRIHVTGYIPKTDIWKYYAIGSMAVLPSVWNEPLGLTMIEAQASGIPLITTISGGIPETTKAKTSILLPVNEKIEDNIINAINDISQHEVVWKDKAKLAQEKVLDDFSEEKYYKGFVKAIR